MSTLRLLLSDSYDPWFNLAVEECIFRQMPATQRVLFLWRNADTVVIGRAQNPWKECNTRRMEEDNVRLARAAAAAARCSTISAIPALPLWQANRSTTKPSPPDCAGGAEFAGRNGGLRAQRSGGQNRRRRPQSLRLRLSRNHGSRFSPRHAAAERRFKPSGQLPQPG
jgi:hypothetical protein